MFPLERQMGTAVEQLGLPAVITFKGLISSQFSPLQLRSVLTKGDNCGEMWSIAVSAARVPG